MFPETPRSVKIRKLDVWKILNQRLQDEIPMAKSGGICYLVITHGIFMDHTKYLFDHVRNDANTVLRPSRFTKMSHRCTKDIGNFLYRGFHHHLDPSYCCISGF